MRIGVVPYLNSLPLISGLDADIYREPPARLAANAKFNDIILAPIVTAFEDPSWILLDGIGIGSFGKVETVKLFLKDANLTPKNLGRIYCDPESKTSVALLKILLKHYWDRPTETVKYFSNPSAEADAFLLIGDKVWEQNDRQPAIDLGEAWTTWTGLPFVFACWMTKNRKLAEIWAPKLVATAKKNLENLEGLAITLPPSKRERVLDYWKNLHYLLGPTHRQAIHAFKKYWAAI